MPKLFNALLYGAFAFVVAGSLCVPFWLMHAFHTPLLSRITALITYGLILFAGLVSLLFSFLARGKPHWAWLAWLFASLPLIVLGVLAVVFDHVAIPIHGVFVGGLIPALIVLALNAAIWITGMNPEHKPDTEPG